MLRDGYWMIVLRKGKVFVPTMAQTEAGYYQAIEPVSIADESDSNSIHEAVMEAVERGNPRIPTPMRDDHKEYVLLKHAGVKSLSTFERLARTWKLSKRGQNFLIAPYRPGQFGGSVEDLGRQESFPDSVPLSEVVRRLVERALNEAEDMQSYTE